MMWKALSVAFLSNMPVVFLQIKERQIGGGVCVCILVGNIVQCDTGKCISLEDGDT